MKYLPNALTLLRIVLCVPLLFMRPFSVWFFVLYTICGVSDMLDGYLPEGLAVPARRVPGSTVRRILFLPRCCCSGCSLP